MSTRTKKAPKTSAVHEIKKEEILKQVEDKTPKAVNTKIAELSTTVAEELGALAAKLTEHFVLLDTVDAAIKIKQDELARLHQLQVTAEAADALDDKIQMTREEWEREKVKRDMQWTEEDQEHQKELQRAEESYEYAVSVDRKKRQRQFEDDLADKLKAHNTQVETRNKQLDERQATLNAAEQELNSLRTRVANFDQEVKKVADKEVAVISNVMKKDYETKVTVLQTQTDRDLTLAKQRVEAAESQVERLNEQVEDLKRQLSKAQEDIKSISTAAFSSVSGQAALAAVKDMQRTEPTASSSRNR